MTDAFALLGLERRPWLDPDDIKRRFHELSAPWHPDRHHGASEPAMAEALQRYSSLNAAHQLLAEPRERLLHLIELESGAKPKDIQRIPPGTMDLFVEVGHACRECDAFLQRRGTGASPMLRLKSMQEGLEWTEKLEDVASRVRAMESALNSELRDLGRAWADAPPQGNPARIPSLPIDRLEQIYRTLSYVSRWLAQVRERVVLLATG
jgi:curved DNA-binding protein CbpA